MRKLLIICMIAMLSLGLMGFGFAKWSDTVAINTTVNTGNVLVGIVDMGVNDTGLDPNVPPGVPPEIDKKDVGSIVSTNGTAIGQTGYYENITETITNAYPYYAPGSTMRIASLGSVPVKLESLDIVWSGALADNVECATWTVTYPNGYTVSGNTFDGLKNAILGVQLHQNQYLEVFLQVFFNQQSEMLSSATGTFTVTASQWNEVTVPNPQP